MTSEQEVALSYFWIKILYDNWNKSCITVVAVQYGEQASLLLLNQKFEYDDWLEVEEFHSIYQKTPLLRSSPFLNKSNLIHLRLEYISSSQMILHSLSSIWLELITCGSFVHGQNKTLFLDYKRTECLLDFLI